MNVNPNLPVSLTIAASANPVPDGNSVTFTATPINGGTAPSFQWKVNNVNAGTNSYTFTYTPLNNDVVTCSLASSLTCSTGNPATSNPVTMIVNSAKTLNLKLYLEGLYAGSGLMNKAQNAGGDQFPGTIADKITVELHNSIAPYAVAYSYDNVDLNTDGTVVISGIPAAVNGMYYIGIRHRNSIEVWSSLPVNFGLGSILYYDITTNASMVFGNNLKQIGSRYVIYGGDVNQDGLVDSGDMIPVDNDSRIFNTGYLATDANGDGLIDSSDMIILDNNGALFIARTTP
jgi:hypothetical protein